MGMCVSTSNSTIQQAVVKEQHLPENLFNELERLLKNIKEEFSNKHSNEKRKETSPSINDLDPALEVEHPDFNDHAQLVEHAQSFQPAVIEIPKQIKQTLLQFTDKRTIKEQIWNRKSQDEKKYSGPEQCMGEKTHVRYMPNYENHSKRMIISMSDLHLDSKWSRLIDERLNDAMIALSSIAKPKINTLVLLGDIFDMWLMPLTKTPSTREEVIQRWSKHPSVATFVHIVTKMAEEDSVKVFYLRGSHDHQMDAKVVETIFGNKVEFIDGTLIYVITVENQEYRIRFTHGHELDLVNTYSVTDDDDVLYSRPFGYYITRALESTPSSYCDTQQVLSDVILKILEGNPSDLDSAAIVDMLSRRSFQTSFQRLLLEKALRRNVDEEDYIVMDGGKWIKLLNVIKYRLFERAIAKFGVSGTFSLLIGAAGSFDEHSQEWCEDVIVTGHTHSPKFYLLSNRNGEMVYVNTGSWIDYKEEVTFAKIVPPTEGDDGVIEICQKVEDIIDRETDR